MTDVDTDIEPPGLDDDEDDGEPILAIMCCMNEGDGTRRSGYVGVDPDTDDATIAAAMIDAMIGTAAMRSPGLADALRRSIREAP